MPDGLQQLINIRQTVTLQQCNHDKCKQTGAMNLKSDNYSLGIYLKCCLSRAAESNLACWCLLFLNSVFLTNTWKLWSNSKFGIHVAHIFMFHYKSDILVSLYDMPRKAIWEKRQSNIACHETGDVFQLLDYTLQSACKILTSRACVTTMINS